MRRATLLLSAPVSSSKPISFVLIFRPLFTGFSALVSCAAFVSVLLRPTWLKVQGSSIYDGPADDLANYFFMTLPTLRLQHGLMQIVFIGLVCQWRYPVAHFFQDSLEVRLLGLTLQFHGVTALAVRAI